MKVLILLALIAFASNVNSQIPPPLPVITFDMSGFNQPQMVHQMHGRENEMEQQNQIEFLNQQRQNEMQHMMEMQHDEMMHQMEQQRQHENQMMQNHQQHEMMMNQQGRDAGQMAEEPIVGLISPLDLKLAKPLGFGGIGLPLPGLRFSNLNLGHLGGLGFGHSLLGAGNPMAEDNLEAAPPTVGKSHHHHHHVEPLVGAAPDQQGFIGWPFLHWANPDDEVGAFGPEQPMPQHMPPMMPMQPMQSEGFDLAAPPMQFFDMQPIGPPMIQPTAPPMMQPMAPLQPFEMVPQQVEDGARHFWKKGGYGYE